MLTQEYRPKSFAEMQGQDMAKRVLRHVVLNPDKSPRTLIFAGERGLGKTTSSRILARALNCERHTGDCCNECKACKAILEGNSNLYVELDSAVVGNVETMRGMRDSLAFSVARGYRVVNLDETHLVSKAAQGALLKVLEESPKGVFWILSTTNVEQLLPTIVSRAVVVNYELLTDAQMMTHLKSVADKEGIIVSENALVRAARRVHGHVRDGMQQLELIRLMGESEYSNNMILLDELYKTMLDYFLRGDCDKAKETILRIVQAPVAYIEQDFELFMRRVADALYVTQKASDERLKELLSYWLRMHRYLRDTNDWYLFLVGVGQVVKKKEVTQKSVSRFSR